MVGKDHLRGPSLGRRHECYDNFEAPRDKWDCDKSDTRAELFDKIAAVGPGLIKQIRLAIWDRLEQGSNVIGCPLWMKLTTVSSSPVNRLIVDGLSPTRCELSRLAAIRRPC